MSIVHFLIFGFFSAGHILTSFDSKRSRISTESMAVFQSPIQRLATGPPLARRLGTILLIGLIAVTAGCAHHRYVVYRVGPSLCEEGPPDWLASDGRRIMYRTWGPEGGNLRAVVVALPGWNGTAGDIEPLARYLALRGIRVYSSGVRGQHGDLTATSLHAKGDIDDGRRWTRDYCEFTAWVRRRHPRTPLFLYGQSMGALTVLTAADSVDSRNSGAVRGVILHSPAVAMMYAAPPVRTFVGLMRRLYGKRLLFNVGLIPGDKPALTSDAAFDKFWGDSSDRVRPGFTWRFLDEAMKLGDRARIAAARVKMPVLLLTGDKDPIGTAGVGQRAFSALIKSIPSSSKERDRFPNGYHDLIHDPNSTRALQCVGAWIEKNLRPARAAAAAAESSGTRSRTRKADNGV